LPPDTQLLLYGFSDSLLFKKAKDFGIGKLFYLPPAFKRSFSLDLICDRLGKEENGFNFPDVTDLLEQLANDLLLVSQKDGHSIPIN